MADSIKGIVTDIQRFSVHDGPGIRTLVFLKGCPLSCPWCCNPETQEADPELLFYEFKCIECGKCVAACAENAIGQAGKPRVDRGRCTLCGECAKACPSGALKMRGDPMTVDEVYAVIEKDRIFYDKSGGGVTFSGGEPLVQWEFLLAMLEKLRREGIHTAVETTGYAPWETVEKVKGRVDLFLYDLKILDDAVHRETVGVSNDLVRENLGRLASDGAQVIVRIPVIPGYTQDVKNIRSIFSFVASLGRIKTVHLLPYHGYGKSKYKSVGRTYGLEDVTPPEREDMDALAARAEDFGLECVIGG
jgi:pyruvate formate lyase activating enzyme